MRDKGRIRVGADADLTLFDPARVRDRATWAAPATPPDGIDYVIVGGVPVVERGVLRAGRQAGAAGAGADPLAARHTRYTGNPAAASSSPHSGA